MLELGPFFVVIVVVLDECPVAIIAFFSILYFFKYLQMYMGNTSEEQGKYGEKVW